MPGQGSLQNVTRRAASLIGRGTRAGGVFTRAVKARGKTRSAITRRELEYRVPRASRKKTSDSQR